jgi:5-methylcytosine-specific restriction endonuclease McrA|tara:strand:+ start:730 stop:1083 length:354 start_codon:yes stop_codon:yes gene_type:complete
MTKKISYYRRKCDRLLQEWGRRTYKKCLICDKKLSCLHHYWPKSKASALRYDKDNLIPICNGCHLMHHTGNPDIHNKINEIKGNDWCIKLRRKKEKIIKPNIGYYKKIIETYEKINN